MYVGFDLKFNDDFNDYMNNGTRIYKSQKKQVRDEIEKFILDDGTIDGSDMQNSWFPKINTDIFISHSHNDREKAIAFAGWLNTVFDLNVFIDSTVWGNANELLRLIDDKYCLHSDGNSYSYEKRNFSTSHIHTMLSSALMTMIDQSECMFLLNTPKSINTSSVINKTHSPWIYYEIGVSKFIRKRKPNRKINDILKKSFKAAQQELNIEYKLDIDHLSSIKMSNLREWKQNYLAINQKIEIHGLDLLYAMYNLLEIK